MISFTIHSLSPPRVEPVLGHPSWNHCTSWAWQPFKCPSLSRLNDIPSHTHTTFCVSIHLWTDPWAASQSYASQPWQSCRTHLAASTLQSHLQDYLAKLTYLSACSSFPLPQDGSAPTLEHLFSPRLGKRSLSFRLPFLLACPTALVYSWQAYHELCQLQRAGFLRSSTPGIQITREMNLCYLFSTSLSGMWLTEAGKILLLLIISSTEGKKKCAQNKTMMNSAHEQGQDKWLSCILGPNVSAAN